MTVISANRPFKVRLLYMERYNAGFAA